MKNYRAGFSVGSSVGRHLKKGVERLKEHAAKKEAKKVQAGKDKIQKSEMGYAEGGRTGLKKGGPKPGTHDYFLLHKREKKKEGGRAGHALGHTAGRLTKTLERVGGGPEGKPHSTKKGRIAAGVRRIKRGAKSWNKKLNKMAKDAHLGRPFMKLEKPKKKKDYVIDPDETFGGRRKEKRPGVPPIPSPQDPKHFKEIPPRFAGGGKALRGLGRAFVKGGKV